MKNTIEQLVTALPEKYQPIFGHPEISVEASRACEDRLVAIRETHDALQALLGRPLRVLDLGCAQGFFSLSLAAVGADVLGIDYLPSNVAVCEALASERPNLKARFQVGRIEEIIERIQPDEFDLVLGLSVFHHVIYEYGILAVKKLLNIAAERVGCLLLEVALKSEPIYWGPSQPDDPRELLDDIAFAHQLALYPTHLADIPRPMFVASNRFWVLSEEAQQILSWTTEPHDLVPGVHQGGRRYYKSPSRFLKWYRIDKPHLQYNQAHFQREIEFLDQVSLSFVGPKVMAHGSNNTEAWLVMERVEGVLLSDSLVSGAEIDITRVLGDVISQVCQFEEVGWYHNDIRTWNTLIQEDGSAILIDYGSMVRKPHDCVWPNNIFLAFLIFLHEVTTRHVEPPLPLRAVAMTPERFPAPYNTLVRRLWAVPVAQWSFGLVKKFFDEMGAHAEASTQPFEAWSSAIETALQALSASQHRLGFKAEQAEAKAEQAEAKTEQAEARVANAEAAAQQAQTRSTEAEAHAASAEAAAEQAQAAAHNAWLQYQAVIHSTSWRLTKPLRLAAVASKWLARGGKAWLMFVPGSRPRRILRRMVLAVAAQVQQRPRLKAMALRGVNHFPRLKQRLQLARNSLLSTATPVSEGLPAQLGELSPHARRMYMRLEAAIEKKNKGIC